jgi:hypothetical protein
MQNRGVIPAVMILEIIPEVRSGVLPAVPEAEKIKKRRG